MGLKRAPFFTHFRAKNDPFLGPKVGGISPQTFGTQNGSIFCPVAAPNRPPKGAFFGHFRAKNGPFLAFFTTRVGLRKEVTKKGTPGSVRQKGALGEGFFEAGVGNGALFGVEKWHILMLNWDLT